ncbi:MAG: 23S rRNA (pseudouridine(1915)-N(3))-methyltransferase RlmH [Clostridiales Family XIII bacterium]|jgi:23S rRNA (pseudouridine1915-N3)-methyltransferase|nr:23S rRNA (pseudouridine(1915)-N(3))-methyltransferase RlmH [Clostridiales Family XIII bacterium]
MTNIDILCVGTLKEKYWREAEAEYVKRLSAYGKIGIVQVKETPLPANPSPANEEAVVRAEGKALLNAVGKRSFVVALDSRGEQFSSEAFAEKLRSLAVGGVSRIAFLIGGSLGLSDEARGAARLQLSFSKMTFPHQMMRIVLLEQIYRGFRIANREAYHK